MEKIKNEIMNLESKVTSCDNWSKFFRIFFRIIMYCHIGFAGSFAVNAMKGLASGSFIGLLMFGGLFGSACIFGGINEFIQKCFRDKKEKLQIKIHRLNIAKKELENKRKNNKSTTCTHLNFNSIGYMNDKEMKLTLRK